MNNMSRELGRRLLSVTLLGSILASSTVPAQASGFQPIKPLPPITQNGLTSTQNDPHPATTKAPDPATALKAVNPSVILNSSGGASKGLTAVKVSHGAPSTFKTICDSAIDNFINTSGFIDTSNVPRVLGGGEIQDAEAFFDGQAPLPAQVDCLNQNGNAVVHEVHGEIERHFDPDLGGVKGFLGYPLTDETVTPDGVGRFNGFQGGSIYWTPTPVPM